MSHAVRARRDAPDTARATVAALAMTLAALLGGAQAQRLATLELGFEGAVVADAWNPLRLVLRDVGPVVLEVVIDQGSLREGEVPLVYRAAVRGGSGLSVFDDELFVPAWRSLSWTVRSGPVTVASGSLVRGVADRRPVDLVVTRAPGPWRTRLGDGARVVDVRADRLVARTAAYDGVRSIVVAGDDDPPRVDALVAAAVAGALVVLSDAAMASPALAALAPPPPTAWLRVGAGWFTVEAALEPGPAVLEAARVDHAAAMSAFAAVERLEPPSSVQSMTLLVGAAAYALAVLVVLRFGGVAGIVAAAALAGAASLIAWTVLRPPSPTLSVSRDLVIGGDGLGQRWRLHDIVSLPAADVHLPAAARPLTVAPITTGPDGTTIALGRWRAQQVVERPRAAEVGLRWNPDGVLVNDGRTSLTEVQVKGGPSYGTIAPGARGLEAARDSLPPSRVANALLDVVPSGAAIANDGTTWFVALASEPRTLGGPEREP